MASLLKIFISSLFFCGVSFCQSSTLAIQQPTDCSVLPIARLNDPQDTSSYKLLSHALVALKVGNQANKTAAEANGKKLTGTRAQMISEQLLMVEQLSDTYTCAAFLMNSFQATSENEATARDSITVAFLTLAEQSKRLKDQAVAMFAELDGGPVQPTVARAETAASIQHERDGAMTSLVDAMTLSLMTTLTSSEPSTDKINAFTFTCREKSQLLAQASSLLADKKGSFSKYATLMQDLLTRPYQCKSTSPTS